MMKREFADNVKKLFHDIVTISNGTTNAEQLLRLLQCKVTLPITSYWESHHLRLVYYNVSLDMEPDLSSIAISYSSDYVVVLRDLQHCDPFQLSEYIIALERDIPQWKHIWVADDLLRKEKGKISERLKATLREMRHAWITSKKKMPSNQEHLFRIRFYNTKATELMLDHDNPFWVNKNTEAEILEECALYHIDPPIEEWYSDWTRFTDECNAQKSEHERQLQEHHDKLMKIKHLINLKQLKFEAFIKTIEFHPSVKVSVDRNFYGNRVENTKYGFYMIMLWIYDASMTCRIKYDLLDDCAMKVIEYIKRINDLAPELQCALIDDGDDYYVTSKRHFFLRVPEPFHIAIHSSRGEEFPHHSQLLSSKVVKRINRICNEMKNYIRSSELKAISPKS